MKLWQYDPDSQSDVLYIANWSDERATFYEKETYRYLGIRPAPSYTWSKQFRPKKKKHKSAYVLRLERKRA